VQINSASNVTLDGRAILHAKATAVEVWGRKRLVLSFGRASRARNGGPVIGHNWFPPVPTHVTVRRVVVHRRPDQCHRRHGISGADLTDNLCEKQTTFLRNHLHGLWTSPARISGGGQFAVWTMGDHLTFRGNVIGDGYCANCFAISSKASKLARSNRLWRGAVAALARYVRIEGNKMYNNHADAIFLRPP